MQNLKLRQEDWQNILDHIASSGDAQRVTIEVMREDFGAQTEVENVAFHGLSYDPRGSTLAIRAGAIEHMISHPASIEIAHAGGHLICLEVLGTDKSRHLITFAPPPPLPQTLISIAQTPSA